MTNDKPPIEKPCLPECYGYTDHDEQKSGVMHAPGCDNERKPPLASMPKGKQ